MVASIDQWLERLQELANELEAIPQGPGHAQQLRQLLASWQASRSALDQDFLFQLSFFLGNLSAQLAETGISHRIRQFMQEQKTASPGSISAQPGPSAGTYFTSRSARTATESTDEEFIDFDTAHRPDPGPEAAPVSGSAGSVAADASVADEGGDEAEETPGEPIYPEVERRVNSAYRLHLDRKHGEIEKLQELLAQKANEALQQNKEFGAMLQTERAALEQASSVEEINEMKQILIGSADELLAGQRHMEEKLRSSFEYLQVIKSDSERLHSELNKVRLLSLTDENTGLPNRRAFLRRLEDEIQRARQYDIPLTLALIDLDYFKEINDQYGHPAGDAVLNWYAQEGLPIFRHYDMVARYGGEEFAVIFPGTTAEGAGHAIDKLREHVAGKHCEYEGDRIAIPGFSAGLASFRENEGDASLIKRADQALYRAKDMGRNRTELEKRRPPADDAVGREP